MRLVCCRIHQAIPCNFDISAKLELILTESDSVSCDCDSICLSATLGSFSKSIVIDRDRDESTKFCDPFGNAGCGDVIPEQVGIVVALFFDHATRIELSNRLQRRWLHIDELFGIG